MARKAPTSVLPSLEPPVALEVRVVRLDTLTPDPHNVRLHPEKNLKAIQGSLAAFGQQKPVIVDAHGTILAGNGAYLAAQRLGWEWITVQVSTLTPDQARAYALADNRTGELSLWDDAALAELLRDLSARELPLPGWDEDELKQLCGGPTSEIDEADIPPDRGTELREQYGVEPGQLWQCGVHRLLCADSLIPANLARLLDADTPQMVWADPPYGLNIVAVNGYVGGGEANNIPFGGKKKGYVGGGESYKAKHGEYAITRDKRRGQIRGAVAGPFGGRKKGSADPSDIVDTGKYAPVLGDESPETAKQAATYYRTTFPSAVQVWWGGNFYTDALTASPCWLVWNKDNSTTNFADCELAWTNQSRAVRMLTHRWHGMLRASEHERRWHPTQKPAALAAWAFDLLGDEGDLIVDPFLGCGPSLVAAAQTGRRLYGMELSPEYIAVSLHRWAVLTGETPTREA